VTLEEVLREKAKEQPHKMAFVLEERRVSYLELEENSNKIANQLIKLGVEKGDRVVFLLPSSPEVIINYFGVTKAGGIAAPLDTRLKLEDLDSLLKECQPKVLIAEEPFLEKIAPNLPKFSSIKYVIEVSPMVTPPFLSYWDILSTGSAQSPELRLNQEDIVLLRYTSGTTGRAKAAMLSQQNMFSTRSLWVEPTKLTSEDTCITLGAITPSWLIVFVAPNLIAGSTVVLVPSLAVSQLLQTITRETGSVVFVFPFVYQETVNMPEEELKKYDLSSVRLYLGGGAPLSQALANQFKQRFGLSIIDGYGVGESVAWLTIQPLDGTGKPGSVGKSPAASELRIVDELGNPLPPNQVGEITVRNTGVMKGYYNRPQATAEVLREDWFYTGDLGKLDEDGYLFILGRKKEMLVVGGQNVFPVDIEEAILTHPKVAEVAVIGIPNKVTGEAIRAVIVPKKGEVLTPQEIENFCRGCLVEHEVPKEIIFRDSLLRTPKGTIRREELQRL